MKTHGLVTAIVVGIGLSWLVFQVDGPLCLRIALASAICFAIGWSAHALADRWRWFP